MVVSACNEGDLGLIPGSGRSPGEGNGNPLQYSYLENPNRYEISKKKKKINDNEWKEWPGHTPN